MIAISAEMIIVLRLYPIVSLLTFTVFCIWKNLKPQTSNLKPQTSNLKPSLHMTDWRTRERERERERERVRERESEKEREREREREIG